MQNAKDIFKQCPLCHNLLTAHQSRNNSIKYYACQSKKHAFYNENGQIGKEIEVKSAI